MIKRIFKGCPNAVTVVHADSDNNADIKDNVLHDNCDEWIAPEGTIDNDAELILHLGCHKKITSFQIRNMRSDLGGTKSFSLFIGNSLSGPWHLITSGELDQTDTCTDQMEKFWIEME